MKVLVCGGRDYDDYFAFGLAMRELFAEQRPSLIIHGAARGADALADQWAFDEDISVLRFPADWSMHGKAAGPMRNQRMIDESKPDMVVAFPGGNGTADMVSRAQKQGIRVQLVRAH